MGRPYAKELQVLPATFEWARSIPIDGLHRFVVEAQRGSMICVGSGGSMAAAHFAALLHRQLGRGISRHVTPLELLLDEPMLSNSAVLFLSASGRNRDVVAASRAAIGREVPALGVLCTRAGSQLAREARAYGRAHVFDEENPSGKDGFLATNSLLATLVILARAYGVMPVSLPTECCPGDKVDLTDRRSLLVLHGGWGAPAATDLESRLHEAALAGVQVTDYRNFGHGRHLWLATRAAETAVLALETPEISALAKRTLGLIPSGIPILRLTTRRTGPLAAIDLMWATLKWTDTLAKAQGVDPGRPRVPEFGRKMFHLRPPKLRKGSSDETSVAVRRKLDRIHAHDEEICQVYSRALQRFLEQLSSASLGGVVLDYDGTLCDHQHRFSDLPSIVTESIARLLDIGLSIGIATGRGKSVREAVRRAIPEDAWNRVLVGYYNGGAIGSLSSDDVPDPDADRFPAIGRLQEVLGRDETLRDVAQIEVRPSQITVTARDAGRPAKLDIYTYLLDMLGSRMPSGIRILRSGHSVDIVASGTSKLSVVHRIEEAVAPRVVLCIGDRGAWPGNDTQLLGHAYSLSVDHVSSDPASCWNIATAGCVGIAATLAYLQAIKKTDDGSIRFDLKSLGRHSS